MMMVKAYRHMRTLFYSNNVLVLEDILMVMIHGCILTKVVYDHGLQILSCHSYFVKFILCGQ
jgi:hypothetical protein